MRSANPKSKSLGPANDDDRLIQAEIDAARIMVGDPPEQDHTCPGPCVQCAAWVLVRLILV